MRFEKQHKQHKQLRETAIGIKMAPPYAIIFMGDLEEKLFKDCDKKPVAWWRYIDDIFMLWQHSEKELEKCLEFLNCYYVTIKFTANYSREKIHFLDVSVRKKNNRLVTDLSVPYHVYHSKKSIPYSQALRWLHNKFLKPVNVRERTSLTI